ncbi:MAG: SHOCT domain-containing protein [Pseudomonadota bacterium]
MSNLTESARQIIADVAQRYGLSFDAVEHMARAVANGGGIMAQFNVPELGGSGQWMSGGMTMVGDMFNHGLQARVANLCGELSNAMAGTPFFERPQVAPGMMGDSNWWPAELGQPASTGGQNQARYAYFPQARRLAFDPGNGQPVILLDTGDHMIGGFSQQQSGPGDPFLGVSVSSQFGQFALSSFPRVDAAAASQQAAADGQNATRAEQYTAVVDEPVIPLEPATPMQEAGSAGADDILVTIGRLAELRDMGALSEEEFSAKKAELLSRL